MVDVDNERSVRVWAIEKAMELQSRHEITAKQIAVVADVLTAFVLGDERPADRVSRGFNAAAVAARWAELNSHH